MLCAFGCFVGNMLGDEEGKAMMHVLIKGAKTLAYM